MNKKLTEESQIIKRENWRRNDSTSIREYRMKSVETMVEMEQKKKFKDKKEGEW